MNILLLGYGKMGQLIGEIAESRGHNLAGKINIDNREDLDQLNSSNVDVAIEFSQPEALEPISPRPVRSARDRSIHPSPKHLSESFATVRDLAKYLGT